LEYENEEMEGDVGEVELGGMSIVKVEVERL